MSKDHYVAQTYLKEFTNENGKIIPYYKNARIIIGKERSIKYVCSEEDGDTNKYFSNNRILEEYLKCFENKWKENVDNLKNQKINGQIKYEISGYLAYLRTCTKTAKRLAKERLKLMVEPLFQKVAEDNLPKNKKLRRKIRRLLKSNGIKMDIDSDYPQAFNIQNLIKLSAVYFASDWNLAEITSEDKFITSDNPLIPLIPYAINKLPIFFVPLTSKHGLFIRMIKDYKDIDIDNLEFDKSTISSSYMKKESIVDINIEIIKNAEEYILHSEENSSIENLVKPYKGFQTKLVTKKIPTSNGYYVYSDEIASDT